MVRILTLLAMLLVAASAMAQTLTLDSPCGAPGTGIRRIDGATVTESVGIAGWHVDADGGWTTCQMPRALASCLVPRGNQWTVGRHRCSSPNGGMTVQHGGISGGIVAIGKTEGVLILQCVDGVLSTRLATCSPISRCEGSHTITDDGGRTVWRWAGSIAIGGRDVAVSDDGDTRPVQCMDNGTMRLL